MGSKTVHWCDRCGQEQDESTRLYGFTWGVTTRTVSRSVCEACKDDLDCLIRAEFTPEWGESKAQAERESKGEAGP